MECIADSTLFSPTGPAIKSSSLPPSSGPHNVVKLFCFDFDLTLAATHLYFELAQKYQPRSEADWITSYKSEYEGRPLDVFGGEERVRKLRVCLSGIRDAGAESFVVTKGVPGCVREALVCAGLGDYFVGVTDFNPKQLAVLALMNSRAERLRYDQAVLIDDDPRNFAGLYTPQSLLDGGWTSEMVALYGTPAVECSEERGWGKEGIGESGYCRVFRVEKDKHGIDEGDMERIRNMARETVGMGDK
jgi:hypothetical protein